MQQPTERTTQINRMMHDMGVSVTLPLAEFVDRFLICVLKNEKLSASLSTWESPVVAWLREHETDFLRIVRSSPEISQAAEELRKVHAQLWLLEDEVRKEPPLPERDFATAARRIFALNSERHGLKARIDKLAGAFSFGERIYEPRT